MNKMMSGLDRPGNGELSHEFATSGMSVSDAAYHTAHSYPGGVAPLALRMGQRASTLNHKVSLTNTTHHLSLEEAVVMQAMSGNYSVLHAMASSLGHVALQIDPVTDAKPMEEVARMVREFGELLTSVTQSMADGTVTTNEMRECQRQAMESIGAIYGVMAAVRSMLPESLA